MTCRLNKWFTVPGVGLFLLGLVVAGFFQAIYTVLEDLARGMYEPAAGAIIAVIGLMLLVAGVSCNGNHKQQ